MHLILDLIIGIGLGPMSSDTKSVEIMTYVYFWTRVTIWQSPECTGPKPSPIASCIA